MQIHLHRHDGLPLYILVDMLVADVAASMRRLMQGCAWYDAVLALAVVATKICMDGTGADRSEDGTAATMLKGR